MRKKSRSVLQQEAVRHGRYYQTEERLIIISSIEDCLDMLRPYKWSDIQKYIQDDSTKAEFVCNVLWGIGHFSKLN